MEDVLRFLKTYEPWIYLVLVGTGLFAMRRMLTALQELRTAVFGLERESAQRRFRSSLSIFLFVLMLAASEFVLTTIVFPDFPNVQAMATSTADLLAIPTVTLPPVSVETPQAEAIGIPTLDVTDQDGCVPGLIEWTFPKAGETLKGLVTLRGTVSVPNLGFYKYEYNDPATNLWVTIAAGDRVIVDQPLGGEGSGQWDTTTLTPGDYRLRLVVTDNVNNVFPACVIPVRISAP
mgnify:FL=1